MKGLAAVLATCVLLATMAFTAHGQATVARILATTQDTFTVDCKAQAEGGIVQKDFGTFTMSAGGLPALNLPLVDETTVDITCNFAYTHNGANLRQQVSVFTAPALNCGDQCLWTVSSDGFYLFDPVADHDNLIWEWVSA